MTGDRQSSLLKHHSSKVFAGVRFLLLGFDPLNKANVLKMLVDGGAVDAGQLGPNCTHVIVHRIVYDDPRCVAARNDGKILVTGLWVDHSFDVGVPVDHSSIMYRPLRDLNGIPGAKFLLICLTGYQHQDREDIMTMVGLMGANFSKPLLAHKVTHLVCYKFEGEKYELAKKMKRIKLVNHLWLEDCLRAWEILSEENYDKSGYDLATEAEAKDSEVEGEGVSSKQHTGRAASICHPYMLKEESFGEPLDCFSPRSFGNIKTASTVMEENSSAQVPNHLEMPHRYAETLTACHATGENELTSTSKDLRTPNSDASKLSTINYSRKTPKGTLPPTDLGEGASNLNSSIKRRDFSLSKAFEFSSSTMPQESLKTDAIGLKAPIKGFPPGSEEKRTGTLSEKRKIENISGSSKLQKVSSNTKALIPNPSVMVRTRGAGLDLLRGSKLQKIGANTKPHISEPSLMVSRTGGAGLDCLGSEQVDISTHFSLCKSDKTATLDLRKPSSISNTKSSNLTWKSVERSSPMSKNVPSETMQEENAEGVKIYSKCLNFNSKLRDVSMSTLQSTKVEDQKQLNEAPEIAIRTPCTEKLESKANTEYIGVGVRRPEHLADTKKTSCSANTGLQTGEVLQSDSKSLGMKMVGNKILGLIRSIGKGKTTNEKDSIFLKKKDPMNVSLTCSGAVEEIHLQKVEMAGAATISRIVLGTEKADCHSEKLAEGSSVCIDDETEPPEDKEAPAGEKLDKVGDGIEGRIVKDEEQHKGRQSTAVRGMKGQLNKSFHTKKQTREKIMIGKTRSLSKSKKAYVPSVLHSSTEKTVHVDSETESPERKEEAVGEKYEEAEPDSTSLKAKEGKKTLLGKSVDAENLVQAKITKGNKCSSSKSSNKACPTLLCVTTELGPSRDEPASEDKNKKEETKKHAVTPNVHITNRALAKNELQNTIGVEKENQSLRIGAKNKDQSKKQKRKTASKISTKSNPKVSKIVRDLSLKKHVSQSEPVWFILSGHRVQRKEFRQVLKRLKGRVCRDSHQWSYQATHFIVPDPIRRTEKFFAAAASGRWILRADFLTACNQAGMFLSEEPYEWHKNCLSDDHAINLEAPRKWRVLKEKTGHGAFYGMCIIIYGECISPPLDTLKRAVKAGDGTILATSPPYTRFLGTGIDFAVVSPGISRVDVWVQEFLRHEIPCVVADYLVEYICKPGYSLESHVLYNTHAWAEKSFNNLKSRLQEIIEPSSPTCDNDIPCQACGARDREDVMLICGDESGSTGCGVGAHIDCCDPPLDNVPEEDWYCPMCSKTETSRSKSPQKKTTKKIALALKRK